MHLLELARDIRSAFGESTLPAPVQISASAPDEGTTAQFANTHWSGHSTQEIELFTHALSFFTPAAWACFLPAFLLAAIDSPNRGIADCVIERILPPKGDLRRPSFLAWWSLLSDRQTAVVLEFLRQFRAHEPQRIADLLAKLETAEPARP